MAETIELTTTEHLAQQLSAAEDYIDHLEGKLARLTAIGAPFPPVLDNIAEFIRQLSEESAQSPPAGLVVAWYPEDIIERLIQIVGFDPTGEPTE